MEKDMNGSFEFIGNPKAFANETSPCVAYLGDAYFELLAREKLISEFGYGVAELSKKQRLYHRHIPVGSLRKAYATPQRGGAGGIQAGKECQVKPYPRSAPVSITGRPQVWKLCSAGCISAGAPEGKTAF